MTAVSRRRDGSLRKHAPFTVHVDVEPPAPRLRSGERVARRRYLTRTTSEGVRVSVDVTSCTWCGNHDHICTACADRLDQACREVEEGTR